MYLFPSSFSLTHPFPSTTVPGMLANTQAHRRAVSCAGCLSQLCFSLGFVGLDVFLLAVTAQDRLVAICHRCYSTVVSPRGCLLRAPRPSPSLSAARVRLGCPPAPTTPSSLLRPPSAVKLSRSCAHASPCAPLSWTGARPGSLAEPHFAGPPTSVLSASGR
ncbi:Olfactory receptor 7A10 [Sciurus carolinensis]|uniref:Olfactory receptor 7A10 n=1 Tax=Sciurus carolinensis TaxID=30640 RepID=A0AA41NK70_SCICA|nr:Olfactory receptor 7A10 [Sciurus carolinensis]